ncbi:flavin reductase family protein [Streptomyces sp. NPDC048106]|uniref:flavin reductase family protein n=1 Tax=Streptomyces sp. NPDC048106 TaxID=3155750 RepID=UPI0034516F59
MTDTLWEPKIRAQRPEAGPPADPRRLRDALGAFATGVVVVTYRSEGTDYGVTVNSFTSVSMDPPLVLVSMQRTSRALSYLLDRPFAVNVLGDDQLATALRFAGKPQDAHVVQWIDDDNAPRISGSPAYFQCRPWASYDGGDHVLVVGQVVSYGRRDDTRPLLFHRGKWGSLAEEQADDAAGEGRR